MSTSWPVIRIPWADDFLVGGHCWLFSYLHYKLFDLKRIKRVKKKQKDKKKYKIV